MKILTNRQHAELVDKTMEMREGFFRQMQEMTAIGRRQERELQSKNETIADYRVRLKESNETIDSLLDVNDRLVLKLEYQRYLIELLQEIISEK